MNILKYLWPKSPENQEKIENEVEKNAEAKRTLLHKAYRHQNSFDDLAISISCKRSPSSC